MLLSMYALYDRLIHLYCISTFLCHLRFLEYSSVVDVYSGAQIWMHDASIARSISLYFLNAVLYIAFCLILYCVVNDLWATF